MQRLQSALCRQGGTKPPPRGVLSPGPKGHGPRGASKLSRFGSRRTQARPPSASGASRASSRLPVAPSPATVVVDAILAVELRSCRPPRGGRRFRSRVIACLVRPSSSSSSEVRSIVSVLEVDSNVTGGYTHNRLKPSQNKCAVWIIVLVTLVWGVNPHTQFCTFIRYSMLTIIAQANAGLPAQ